MGKHSIVRPRERSPGDPKPGDEVAGQWTRDRLAQMDRRFAEAMALAGHFTRSAGAPSDACRQADAR